MFPSEPLSIGTTAVDRERNRRVELGALSRPGRGLALPGRGATMLLPWIMIFSIMLTVALAMLISKRA